MTGVSPTNSPVPTQPSMNLVPLDGVSKTPSVVSCTGSDLPSTNSDSLRHVTVLGFRTPSSTLQVSTIHGEGCTFPSVSPWAPGVHLTHQRLPPEPGEKGTLVGVVLRSDRGKGDTARYLPRRQDPGRKSSGPSKEKENPFRSLV